MVERTQIIHAVTAAITQAPEQKFVSCHESIKRLSINAETRFHGPAQKP